MADGLSAAFRRIIWFAILFRLRQLLAPCFPLVNQMQALGITTEAAIALFLKDKQGTTVKTWEIDVPQAGVLKKEKIRLERGVYYCIGVTDFWTAVNWSITGISGSKFKFRMDRKVVEKSQMVTDTDLGFCYVQFLIETAGNYEFALIPKGPHLKGEKMRMKLVKVESP